MPEGNQDQRGVAVAIAAVPGRLDELVDLGRREIFACPKLAISGPNWN